MSSRTVSGQLSRSHYVRLALMDYPDPEAPGNAEVARKAEALLKKAGDKVAKVSPNMVSVIRCDLRKKYGAVTRDACRAMNAGDDSTTTFLAGAARSAAEKTPTATFSSPITTLPPASFAPGVSSGSESAGQAASGDWEPTAQHLWAAKNFADSVGGIANAVTALHVLDTLRK